MDLKPPISERSTPLLIHMASNSEEWQPEAQALARMELERRGVDPAVIHQAQREVAAERAADLRQRALNAEASYSIGAMAITFLAAPFLLFLKLLSWKLPFPFKLGLSALDKDNFNKKYRQRMTMLVAGTLFWVLLLGGLN